MQQQKNHSAEIAALERACPQHQYMHKDISGNVGQKRKEKINELKARWRKWGWDWGVNDKERKLMRRNQERMTARETEVFCKSIHLDSQKYEWISTAYGWKYKLHDLQFSWSFLPFNEIIFIFSLRIEQQQNQYLKNLFEHWCPFSLFTFLLPSRKGPK